MSDTVFGFVNTLMTQSSFFAQTVVKNAIKVLLSLKTKFLKQKTIKTHFSFLFCFNFYFFAKYDWFLCCFLKIKDSERLNWHIMLRIYRFICGKHVFYFSSKNLQMFCLLLSQFPLYSVSWCCCNKERSFKIGSPETEIVDNAFCSEIASEWVSKWVSVCAAKKSKKLFEMRRKRNIKKRKRESCWPVLVWLGQLASYLANGNHRIERKNEKRRKVVEK